MIEIYDGGAQTQTIRRVLSANLTDRLSGERTLEFSVLASRSHPIAPGMVAKHDGQYYSIVRVARSISGGLPVSSVSSEHVSYVLNDEAYNLVTFVFEGTPAAGLAQLLEGTPFSVGVVEPTANVEAAFTEGILNRRSALMRFVDACGGEIEYDGYRINIRSHRGSTTRKVLMDGENVTGLSVVLDSRENTAAYEISLFKMAQLTAGDEVNITYTPLEISVNTRIVGISYNPFYRYAVRVEVGDYVPNLLESTSTQLDRIKQEFRAADGQLISRIGDTEGSVSELTQTVSGFDLRVSDAEGAVSALSLTVDGFNTRISDAEDNLSYIEQSLTSITSRVSSAEGNISTVTQTANKVEWLIKSGTSASNFTLTDRAISLVASTINLTGYVTFSNLSTSGQTTINGANITTGAINANLITTGTLSADRIDTSNLRLSSLYVGTKVAITSVTNSIYIGGDTSGSSFDSLYLRANSTIILGRWSSSQSDLRFDMSARVIRSSDVAYGWSIGTSTYPLYALYCDTIHTKSVNIAADITPTNTGVVTLGNTSRHYKSMYCDEIVVGTGITYNILINSNLELRPSSTSSSYPFYLGTSSYPWHYAYIGSNTAMICTSTSAKLGFFGTTPIARQTLSLTSNNMGYTSVTESNHLYALNNLIGILKSKYGLII